ncbi:unnamed protein product [Clonostachys byssicola]|uniref:Amine oxidase n=1 Tax=Clonostachys byssicola TaxID=160290 RepID=A0A9N9Y3L7_9HYPO|nr:unnamed protein product [Clonostachys byssicola]
MAAVEITKSDVIVIGAGLAGLQTAVKLHEAGLSVTVLEAQDRVGGKTLSVQASALGGTVDLGAAWINDTNQSEMYKLAQEFGFDLIEQRTTGEDVIQMADGTIVCRPYGQQQLPDTTPENNAIAQEFFAHLHGFVERAHTENPADGPDAAMLDSMTFREFADKKFPGGFAASIADGLARGLLGVEANEISTLYIVDYLQSGTGMANMGSDRKDGGQYLRNRQGNQTFSVRLAGKLPQEVIHLSTPVSKVSQTETGECVVETKNPLRPRHMAKRVVVSIPTTLYPSITFEPPLPPAKRELSECTALGYYAKTIFVFNSAWWREAGLSGVMSSSQGPISFSRDSCSELDGQYSITCFIVGDSGRSWSKWSAAQRRKLVAEQFDNVFGRAARDKGVAVPAPVNVIEQEWIKEQWCRGAPSPVAMPGMLTSDSGKAMRTPYGSIHFVGTETATVWKGYMEGAVRSGSRGAQEVIDALE